MSVSSCAGTFIIENCFAYYGVGRGSFDVSVLMLDHNYPIYPVPSSLPQFFYLHRVYAPGYTVHRY